MQLTTENTENTEKHIDSKRETLSFYDFLCAFFYARLNVIAFKNIARGHRELLEIIKSELAKVCFPSLDGRGLREG